MSVAEEKGLVRQQGLSGQITTRTAETSQAAVAEQAKAAVQARFQMAVYRPRNYDDARLAILKTCERGTFAIKARYKKPQYGAKSCGRVDCPQEKRKYGKEEYCDHICGLSIRAADEFAKFYGNIQTEQATLYDDDEQRIIGIAATDLEHNITKSQQIVIKKTVERKKPGDRSVIAWRENSKGEQVAIVAATDDEVMQKEGALCAKARRNLLLQLIPADLLEEAETQSCLTVTNGIDKDPDSAKKDLIKSFDKIGVKPSELEKYLGHSLDGVSQAELADLRYVYSAVADREAKWADFLNASESDDGEQKDRMEGVKSKMREKLNKRKEQPKGGDVSHEFKQARAKLSMSYEGNERKIDDALSSALGMELQDITEDCTDSKVIDAVIELAKEF